MCIRDRSSIIRCEGDTHDRYKKLIATYYNGSMNSNAELIRQGWALAHRLYSKDYILAEKQAKKTQARGVVWEVPKALAVEKEMSSV